MARIPLNGNYHFQWKFLIKEFCFMAFVNFFSCNDPQYFDEVVRFSKKTLKIVEIYFSWKLLSGGIRLFYGAPCLLVDGKL